jgi:hypothetical protein
MKGHPFHGFGDPGKTVAEPVATVLGRFAAGMSESSTHYGSDRFGAGMTELPLCDDRSPLPSQRGTG